jgi:predicted ATPase
MSKMTLHDDVSSITESQYCYSRANNNSLSDNDFKDDQIDALTSLEDDEASLALYGRSHHLQRLRNAYEQVCDSQTKSAITVLVHGVSGSGKTALVHQFRKTVCDRHGFFVTGKYFQGSGVQEPYSAFMAAFSDLCDLVSQSEDFNEDRRLEIENKLGADGHRLEKAVSNLSLFLPNNTAVFDSVHGDITDTRSNVVLAKFMVACKTFLQAMSSKEHPIVLFIDDIQWMDESSKPLLRLLLRAQGLPNVMMIFAYRDEALENTVSDILNDMRDEPEHSPIQLLDIVLRNLEVQSVHELVAARIGKGLAGTEELGNLIVTKTRGNPFHVVQFIQVLKREGLLMHNPETTLWEFDVDRIQRDMMVSDTIAELLAVKMRRLPQQVQDCLKIASLLGYRFREDLLSLVMNALDDRIVKCGNGKSLHLSLQSVHSSLLVALNEGFIEKTKVGYQFSHDKLQTAFQSMISSKENVRLHLAIGQTFLFLGGPESLYHAAVHLHHVPEFVSGEVKRIELALTHLEAAKYCKEKSAFVEAATLLRWGLALLDEHDKKWTSHFELSFEMTQTLAKMELVIGNHDSCKALTRESLIRAKTTEMKIDSLLVDVECCMVCNEMDGSIAAAYRALSVLGIEMPCKIFSRNVVMKLLKVKFMIGRKSDDDILCLPRMRDSAIATSVRLLLHLCWYCFLVGNTLLSVYSALLATELTLKFGLSPYSASAFTIYGMAELVNGNYGRAYRFGKLALSLLDRINSPDAACSTTGLALTWLTHWYDPVRDMPDILRRTASTGFEVGDMVYGSYCMNLSYRVEISLGRNLDDLEDAMRSSYQKIRDLSRDGMDIWSQTAIQFVLNLRCRDVSNWQDLFVLTGEMMDEATYMHKAIAAKHNLLVLLAWSYKAQLACLFGFWSVSESLYEEIKGIGQFFRYSFGLLPHSLFAGIASYSLYAQNNKRKHLRRARRKRVNIARAVSRGCPNGAAFLSMLDAEDLSVRKSATTQDVMAAYTRAIDAMASEGLPHTEALAYERAGFFLAKAGNRLEAIHYFERALRLYNYKWGSYAKHDWLLEASAKALGKAQNEESCILGEVIGIGHDLSVPRIRSTKEC